MAWSKKCKLNLTSEDIIFEAIGQKTVAIKTLTIYFENKLIGHAVYD